MIPRKAFSPDNYLRLGPSEKQHEVQSLLWHLLQMLSFAVCCVLPHLPHFCFVCGLLGGQHLHGFWEVFAYVHSWNCNSRHQFSHVLLWGSPVVTYILPLAVVSVWLQVGQCVPDYIFNVLPNKTGLYKIICCFIFQLIAQVKLCSLKYHNLSLQNNCQVCFSPLNSSGHCHLFQKKTILSALSSCIDERAYLTFLSFSV